LPECHSARKKYAAMKAKEQNGHIAQHAQGKTGPTLTEGNKCSVVKRNSYSHAPVLPPSGPASPVR
jgi:hypothetical protein